MPNDRERTLRSKRPKYTFLRFALDRLLEVLIEPCHSRALLVVELSEARDRNEGCRPQAGLRPERARNSEDTEIAVRRVGRDDAVRGGG